MSRSFLSPTELEKLKADFAAPSFVVDGTFHSREEWPFTGLSKRLTEDLLKSWLMEPSFSKADPVLVGSAARGELCPRSDLDLLFAGDEGAVAEFVRHQQQKGIRIRSRVPQDPADWTVGVDVPDVLALFEAKALTPTGARKLADQRERLFKVLPSKRRQWLKHLAGERTEREARHDSIAGFLEPNLKYGPGGLRDLDQGRQILRLFPERFEDDDHARQILETYAGLWTTLRQKLHLEGQGDLLASSAQFDLARWLGLSHREFMRQVQRGLSRVHFYSTWIFEKASAPERKWKNLAARKLKTRTHAVALLEKDQSVLAQHKVRAEIDRLFPTSFEKPSKERGLLLWRVLRPESDEHFVAAVFQSRLIDKICPEIKPLVGLVQHDQYHRYAADVHLLQACRQWRRVLRNPRRLGVLGKEVRDLSAQDRKILSWSMLYHDLMKGRDGDHSQLGRKLVRKELNGFGVSTTVISEIEWIVEYHLELSKAAFRRNPMSPSTWARLEDIDARGDRLRRLAVFTAVDILATNAEAWTPWKARLLADLLKALRSPTAKSLLRFQKELQRRRLDMDVESLDGFLVSKLPPAALAADLAEAARGKNRLAPLVVKASGGVWIRLHEKEDRPGIFAEYVQRLYSLGLGVRHASAHTLPGLGVYDWFEVTGRRTPAQIRTLLAAAGGATKAPPLVKFADIAVVSQDDDEWVLSFKGTDQPGFLVAAAAALSEEKISIKSARVHTWGRQVDDLFTVEPKGVAEDLLRRLRSKLT